MVLKIYDESVGELRPDEIGLVYTVKQLEAYRKKKQQKQRFKSNGRMFYFVDQINFKEVAEMGLTNKQIGQYLQLATYSVYDGTLLHSSHNKTPLYTLKDWGRVLDVKSYQTVKKLRDALIERGLIYEDIYTTEVGELKKAYRLNPDYAYRGAARSKKLVKVYRTELRKMYKEQGATAVGFIGKLLPYVDYHNVFCHNPFEQDTNYINPLSFSDMAEIVDYRVDETRKMVNGMVFDGKKVFKQERIKGKKVFKLNPELFYRQLGEPVKEQLKPFQIEQEQQQTVKA